MIELCVKKLSESKNRDVSEEYVNKDDVAERREKRAKERAMTLLKILEPQKAAEFEAKAADKAMKESESDQALPTQKDKKRKKKKEETQGENDREESTAKESAKKKKKN